MIDDNVTQICEKAYNKYQNLQSDGENEQKARKNEEYRNKYEDLIQSNELDKRINESLITMLENKVSELIAEN